MSNLQITELRRIGKGPKFIWEPTGRKIAVDIDSLTSSWPHISECEKIATDTWRKWDGIDLGNGAQSLFIEE